MNLLTFLKYLKRNLNHFAFINSGLLFQAARVAQLVERQAFNLNVQGSSPCSGDIYFFANTIESNKKNSLS